MTGPKQMSDKQLAANRANAQRSTGPRTAQGKDVSRWNAVRHGILARSVIPEPLAQFESRADFDEMLDGLIAEFVPASALEQMLVERIAASWWRLARVARAEGGLIADRQERVEKDLSDANDLAELTSRMAPSWKTPPPSPLLDRLLAAWGNKRQLRAVMVEQDPAWREADDQALQRGAEALRAELEQAAQRKNQADAERLHAVRAIPAMGDAAPLARYEASIERHLYTALAALERIKRLRQGEDVPAPDPVSPQSLLAEGQEA